MGNITDMDFELPRPAEDSPFQERAELEKLRAFRAAVAGEIPVLETHASRMASAFPKTSEALRRLIDAFRASE